MLVVSANAFAGVIYVDADAGGANTGSSWADAFTDLADALAAAVPLDEIWVAGGNYFPPGPETPFELGLGVAVYGGFDGTETALDQRDPETNLTVLNGDFSGDDASGFLNRADNARRIMNASGPGPNNRLDGLIFSGGYANNVFPFFDGGALSVDGGTLTIARCLFISNGSEYSGGAIYAADVVSLTVRDSVFLGNATNPNSTGTKGGAVEALDSDTLFERCDFSLNSAFARAAANGGAVDITGGSARFSACTFTANLVAGNPTSGEGGAAMIDAIGARFEDCVFTANRATANTVAKGGAAAFRTGDVDVVRCVFENNAAEAMTVTWGGALFARDPDGVSRVRIGASGFYGNTADIGGAICGEDDSIIFRVVDSVISANEGSGGSGIYSNGETVIRSSTIVANGTFFGSSGVEVLSPGSLSVENSIIWGNGAGPDQNSQLDSSNPAAITHSCIQGWDGSLGGIGNFSADPLFFDPGGPDNTPGTADDNYRLSRGSPCIDAGDNTIMPADKLDLDADGDTDESMPIDVYGRDRRRDDPDTADSGIGNAPIVDIGAAEFQLRSCPADLDFNGILDLADINAFIIAFTAMDNPADLDGNGLYDLADIVLFVGFFNEGCP